MLSLVPVALHGPVLGLVGGVIAIVFLVFSWRLVMSGSMPNDRSIDQI